MKIICVTIIVIIVPLSALTGCASQLPTDIYKLYPGPVRPVESLTVIHLGHEFDVKIDNLSASRRDWESVQLLPGKHSISWEHSFMVSVLINTRGWDKRGVQLDVNLEGGRAYILKSRRTTGRGYRMYLWIEDFNTGEVVAGVKKP